jgi:hypothetical protein
MNPPRVLGRSFTHIFLSGVPQLASGFRLAAAPA